MALFGGRVLVLCLMLAPSDACSSGGGDDGSSGGSNQQRNDNGQPSNPSPSNPSPSNPSPGGAIRGPGWPGLAKGTANTAGSFTGGARNDIVDSSSQLSCNSFDSSCRWKNVENEDQVNWDKGTGRPDPNQMQKYTGTSQIPSEPYAVVAPDRAMADSDKALLVADPLACQQGDGDLTFKYWTTPNVRLRVCAREVGFIDPDYCSPDVTGEDPGPAIVKVPGPRNRAFEVFIEASGFRTADDFAVVDDVSYNGRICSTTSNPSPTTNRPSLPGASGGACQVLKCDFNPGQQCSRAVTGGKNNWQTGKGQTGNRNTGIQRSPTQADGTYAFVDGPTNSEKVLALPSVTLDSPKDLAFQYYKASFGAAFEVRVNGNPAYTDDETTATSRQWRQKSVSLNQGQNQVSFVTRSLKENQYVALDDLNLRESGSGSNSC